MGEPDASLDPKGRSLGRALCHPAGLAASNAHERIGRLSLSPAPVMGHPLRLRCRRRWCSDNDSVGPPNWNAPVAGCWAALHACAAVVCVSSGCWRPPMARRDALISAARCAAGGTWCAPTRAGRWGRRHMHTHTHPPPICTRLYNAEAAKAIRSWNGSSTASHGQWWPRQQQQCWCACPCTQQTIHG